MPACTPAALPHAFGDDADLLDAGALGRVDDGDDFAVPKRTGRRDEHRLVLALLEDVPQPRLELAEVATVCLFTDIWRSACISSTIWLLSTCCCCACWVSAGRLMSRPFCVSGRAAMKMTSSTSSTSIIGVTFMSALASSFFALTFVVGAEVLVRVSVDVISCLPRDFPLGDQAHVFDAGRTKLVHRLHHVRVVDILVGLDEDDFSVCVRQRSATRLPRSPARTCTELR